MSTGPQGVALRDLLPPAGPRGALPVRALVELAMLAERLGYDSVWVPEGRGREAIAVLGAIAAATTTLRLGSGIMPVFSRPPALAAMGLATLDDLSAGRVLFGIGAGHPAITEHGYGHPYARPLRAVREFVEIVRAAISGATVRYAGEVFQVGEFALESVPARAIPVYVAALRRGMLRLAGAIGDGVILNWTTPEQAARAGAVVRAAAREAGRDPGMVTVACFIRACVTDQVDRARLMLRRLIAAYVGLPAYATMFEESGFVDDVQAIAAAGRTGGDAAAAAVSDRMVGALGLIGTPEECRSGLEAFRRAGVDLPIVYPYPLTAGPDSYRRTIEGLAPTPSARRQ